MQIGPLSVMLSSSPVPPQALQTQSLTAAMTTSSLDVLATVHKSYSPLDEFFKAAQGNARDRPTSDRPLLIAGTQEESARLSPAL